MGDPRVDLVGDEGRDVWRPDHMIGPAVATWSADTTMVIRHARNGRTDRYGPTRFDARCS
jgi:hypothetical protein